MLRLVMIVTVMIAAVGGWFVFGHVRDGSYQKAFLVVLLVQLLR